MSLDRIILRDGLGSLGDCMLRQLSREEKADGGLNFAGGECLRLAVLGQLGRLGGDALEEVGDEGVHDTHRLGGDTGVGVDLLQDLVDVDGVRL